MKTALATLLLATACGSDTTELEYHETEPAFYEVSESVQNQSSLDPGGVQPVAELQPAPVASQPSSQNVDAVHEMSTFRISPDPELVGYTRDSARRFEDRLTLPVVLGEGGLRIVVQDEVWDGNKAVSAVAHYYRQCVWTECESQAEIRVARVNLTEQVEWLPNLLDHEIGHVLSAWGQVAKVPMHLPDTGNIMSPINRRENRWTQADIDLWCSAAPCGKTRMNPSWLSPVSDAGTSLHSTVVYGDAGPADSGPGGDN